MELLIPGWKCLSILLTIPLDIYLPIILRSMTREKTSTASVNTDGAQTPTRKRCGCSRSRPLPWLSQLSLPLLGKACSRLLVYRGWFWIFFGLKPYNSRPSCFVFVWRQSQHIAQVGLELAIFLLTLPGTGIAAVCCHAPLRLLVLWAQLECSSDRSEINQQFLQKEKKMVRS